MIGASQALIDLLDKYLLATFMFSGSHTLKRVNNCTMEREGLFGGQFTRTAKLMSRKQLGAFWGGTAAESAAGMLICGWTLGCQKFRSSNVVLQCGMVESSASVFIG